MNVSTSGFNHLEAIFEKIKEEIKRAKERARELYTIERVEKNPESLPLLLLQETWEARNEKKKEEAKYSENDEEGDD